MMKNSSYNNNNNISTEFLANGKRKQSLGRGNRLSWLIRAPVCFLKNVDSVSLAQTSGSRGQFHQPTGAKRKCTATQCLVQHDAVQIHQQNCTQLY